MSPKKEKPQRGRKRKYAPGTSRAEKRRLRALGKLEKQGIDVSQQVAEDTRTDAEKLADMKARFAMARKMINAAAQGQVPSIIIPGAPGIGKTYNTEEVLTLAGGKWVRVTGTISAVELFKTAWEYRHPGEVIVIDDADKVFRDEDAMNLLKAMTDSKPDRLLNWLTNTDAIDEDIDRTFIYRGSVIALSNLDFQAQADLGRGKNAEHIGALISRALYLDLKIYDRRSLALWINYVCNEGRMFDKEGIDAATGKAILEWLHAHKAELREYSLRTVHKMCNLSKMGPDWTDAAQLTLCR